jgi:quercetin dioxygenase-like cupin family protein
MSKNPAILKNESELKWTELDSGCDQQAVLFGDPSAAGVYSFRLLLKAGAEQGRGRPHWHPEYEFGTVLSGRFLVATGDRLDRASAKTLTAGAFIVIPPGVRHAIWAEEDVILQIYGPGPRVTNFGDQT